MNLLLNKRRWEWLIIFIFGLIPFLWLDSGQIIMGHDSGLVLNPISHFIDRLYPWTERLGYGSDQRYAVPGFFIHGLDALIYIFVKDINLMQKIIFSLWFMLPGLTMLWLMRKITANSNLVYGSLPASLFYMFNHYLLQGWFVAERTKFSVYAAAPLLIGFLFEWVNKRRSGLRTAMLISITFFFLNGLASLPLFGGVFIVLIVFTIWYIAIKKQILQLLKLYGIVLIFSCLLHAYWLLPYVDMVITSYAQTVEFFGGRDGVLDWVRYVSEHTSIPNLLRLHGVPEWYQNKQHSYAQTFLNNPFAILVSFAIPLSVIITPLLIGKGRKFFVIVILFLNIYVLSIVFSAGAHPPFGFIYMFLLETVPGFIAFRTPFYKFASSLWFSYAVLFGILIGTLLAKKWKITEKLKNILFVLICVVILFYSYPFFTGNFFEYIKGIRTTRIVVPEYVKDFYSWSRAPERIGKRTLMLPLPNENFSVEAYNWGYWSLSPLSSVSSTASIVNYSSYMSKHEKYLTRQFVFYLKNQDVRWKTFAQILGIESIVIRHDFSWNLAESPTEPPTIFSFLETSTDFRLVGKFGQWFVYDIVKPVLPRIYSTKEWGEVVGYDGNIIEVLTLPIVNAEVPLIFQTNFKASTEDYEKYQPSIVIINSECLMCDLQKKFINLEMHRPLFTPGSLFYNMAELWHRRSLSNYAYDNTQLAKYYAYDSLRKTLALQKTIDEGKNSSRILLAADILVKSLDDLSAIAKSSLSDQANNEKIELLNIILTIEPLVEQIDNNSRTLIEQSNQLNIINNLKLKIENLRGELESQVWRTVNPNHKRFIADVHRSGDYKMYVNKKDYDSVINAVNINGIFHPFIETKLTGDWVEIGSYPLSKGENRIELQSEPSQLHDGSSSYVFDSNKNECFVSTAFEGAHQDLFRINFRHRSQSATEKFFIAVLPVEKELKSLGQPEILESVPEWRDYRLDYAVSGDGQFRAYICNREFIEHGEKAASLTIDNFKIIKLTAPRLVLVKDLKKSGSAMLPSVLEKKSPTEYKAVFSQQFDKPIIVFLESYSPYWHLEGQHVMLWGYANGWFAEGKVKETFVEYTPARLVKIGFLITFIAFIGVIYVLYRK